MRVAMLRVYPRVGGETGNDPSAGQVISGLSPRGRGNRTTDVRGLYLYRSIPAWAGKPTPGLQGLRSTKVYPRVGGETGYGPDPDHGRQGLSPRGRGNPPTPKGRELLKGSIPAWAGKPA